MALFKILRGNETNLFNANGSLKKAWTDGYAYYCTDTHDFYIDHLDSNGKQVRSKLNAKEAEKLRTSRSIAVGGAVTSTATGFDGTSDITIPINSVKEAYLTWGGKNFAANYSPLDGSLIPVLGANRFAFLPEAGITVEYSRDNGTTWTEIESENKHRLFGAYGSNYAGFNIGNNDVNGADTSTYQLRVTIDSVAAKIYTTLNKFAIYVTTAGGQNCWCSIDGKLAKNVISETDTWKNFVSQTKIDGWSGWNIINISNMTTYSGQTSQAEAQYQKIRFTFGNESHKGANYKGLNISQIFAFGGVGWTTPSNMAKYGSIYSYDCEQNVIFPKSITQNSTSGQIYSKGTLKVDGASTLGGAVTANGNLTVKGNTTLGDAYSDTVFAKGTVTIGDNGRTYSQAQTHTLYGGLEMYKGYMYLESIDSQGYFYVDAENRGYTEISGMPLRLVGAAATLTVDGAFHQKEISQFDKVITVGDSSKTTNANTLLDVYGRTNSNLLYVRSGGATIEGDLSVDGTSYLSEVEIDYQLDLTDDADIYLWDSDGFAKAEIGKVIKASAGFQVKDIEEGEIYAALNKTQFYMRKYNDDDSQSINIRLKNDGTIIAATSVASPSFIGDLTGNANTANEAYSLTWSYFDATGTIS